MATYNRQSVIATRGNLPFKAADLDLYLPSSGKGKPVLNLRSGELVAINTKTRKTVDATDISGGLRNIAIGVGVGKHTMADAVRWIAGDNIDLCQGIVGLNADPPSCGTPQVQNVFLAGTECGVGYSIAFLLNDSLVRSRYQFNEDAEYLFTSMPVCDDCTSCEPETSSEAIVDSLVEQINKEVQNDITSITRFPYSNQVDNYQPFSVAKLYTNSYTFTFTGCDSVDVVDGLTFEDGQAGDADVDFTGTTNAAGDATLPQQLGRVVDEINQAFIDSTAVNGSAYLEKKPGTCCEYIIHVNTDDANFLLRGDGSDISPDASPSNPFSGVTVGGAAAVAGFRVFTHPVDWECGCEFPPNKPIPNTFGRWLTIQQHPGDGTDWNCGDILVEEETAPVMPKNMGYYWQRIEQHQHTGGDGRDYRPNNRLVGLIPLPDAGSRDSNITVNCAESYCVYSIETTNTGPSGRSSHPQLYNTGISRILVPEADTATQASLETILDALAATNNCGLTQITCASNQAVDDDTYPDVNR